MFKMYLRLKLEKPVRDFNQQQMLKTDSDPIITFAAKEEKCFGGQLWYLVFLGGLLVFSSTNIF